MKQLLVFCVFMLVLAAPRVRAAPAVTATLTLPNDSVLPGVPFDLVVTYTNVSEKPITIKGASATLIITFASGETTVMHRSGVNDQWSLRFLLPVQLGPGESAQNAASWENGSIPNWFRYESFSGPGTYGIALDLQIVDRYENLLGEVRTPAVTLTRIEPIGIDAELWKRMQQGSEGGWSDDSFAATRPGVALANEIIQLHPTSGYYPYVLALRSLGRGVDKSHIPALLEAAERFPNSPAYPYLLNAAANCARHGGWIAEGEGNLDEAKRYFTVAEAKYREALATKSIVIRASSELRLQNVADGHARVAKKKAR